jgi:hypothetical protein
MLLGSPDRRGGAPVVGNGPSANLSIAVNGIVREMNVHDFQRINTRFDARKHILKESNVSYKSRLKEKGKS